MRNKALLTEADLVAALKRVGVATKEDLQKLRLDTKGDLDKLRLDTKGDLDKLRLDTKGDLQRLERSLKLRMGADRNKILLAIGNLATHTPTLSSFNELKTKVDRILTTY